MQLNYHVTPERLKTYIPIDIESLIYEKEYGNGEGIEIIIEFVWGEV